MVSILPEGKPLWGRPCQKGIEEVDLRPRGGKGSEQDPDDPEAWEKEIQKAGRGSAYVFWDGSLLENKKRNGGGIVGGRTFTVGSDGVEAEVKREIGDVATVWDGEVAQA